MYKRENFLCEWFPLSCLDGDRILNDDLGWVHSIRFTKENICHEFYLVQNLLLMIALTKVEVWNAELGQLQRNCWG